MRKDYQPDVVRAAIPEEPMSAEVRAAYLRPGELLAAQRRMPVAYQPLGTLEWHGRHNPLGCDAIKAEELCIAAAKEGGGVVMPPIFFAADAYRDCGKGYGLGMDPVAGFLLPGSFYRIASEALRDLLVTACENYLARGFSLVVLVSGHNCAIQQNVMDEVCYALKSREGVEPVFATMEYTLIPEGDPRRRGDHGGGYETSMMLHLVPDRVNLNANDGQADPSVALYEAFPVREASAAKGAERFALQVRGLVAATVERMRRSGARRDP